MTLLGYTLATLYCLTIWYFTLTLLKGLFS